MTEKKKIRPRWETNPRAPGLINHCMVYRLSFEARKEQFVGGKDGEL